MTRRFCPRCNEWIYAAIQVGSFAYPNKPKQFSCPIKWNATTLYLTSKDVSTLPKIKTNICIQHLWPAEYIFIIH